MAKDFYEQIAEKLNDYGIPEISMSTCRGGYSVSLPEEIRIKLGKDLGSLMTDLREIGTVHSDTDKEPIKVCIIRKTEK